MAFFGGRSALVPSCGDKIEDLSSDACLFACALGIRSQDLHEISEHYADLRKRTVRHKPVDMLDNKVRTMWPLESLKQARLGPSAGMQGDIIQSNDKVPKNRVDLFAIE